MKFCYLNKLLIPGAICSLVEFLATSDLETKLLSNEICRYCLVAIAAERSGILRKKKIDQIVIDSNHKDVEFYRLLEKQYPHRVRVVGNVALEQQFAHVNLEDHKQFEIRNSSSIEEYNSAAAIVSADSSSSKERAKIETCNTNDPIFNILAFTRYTNKSHIYQYLEWIPFLPPIVIYLNLSYYLRFNDRTQTSEHLIKLSEYNKQLLEEMTREAIESNKFNALKIIQRALATSSNEIAFFSTDEEKKKKYYTIAAELDPLCGVYIYNRGTTYTERRCCRALTDFYDAQQKYPYIFGSYIHAGHTYKRVGLFKDALLQYLKVSNILYKTEKERKRIKDNKDKLDKELYKMMPCKFIKRCPEYYRANRKIALLMLREFDDPYLYRYHCNKAEGVIFDDLLSLYCKEGDLDSAYDLVIE